MITYAEAIKLVLTHISPLPPVEKHLDSAGGLVLAEDVYARWAQPSVDNSAMDGFAFCFDGCVMGDSLPVVGQSYAGHPFVGQVPEGVAIRIMTGAPLPSGVDTVVPLEDVEEGAQTIRFSRSCRKGQHVRRAGEEFVQGEKLLDAGTCLHAGEIGLLAAAGIVRVRVHPAPRVAVLSTGDELVELGQSPGAGQIVNSNLHLLTARLREAGVEVIPLGIAGDNEADLDQRLKSALQADLLLTSGGVSVGDKDQVQEALERLGFAKIFWKVAIKPGKPVLFGKIGSLPVLGLPGNPAASAATCEIFALPAARQLAGQAQPLAPMLDVRLASAIDAGGSRQAFLWGRVSFDAESGYIFTPSDRQSSGQTRAMLGAGALLPVAARGAALAAGSRVQVLLMRLPGSANVP